MIRWRFFYLLILGLLSWTSFIFTIDKKNEKKDVFLKLPIDFVYRPARSRLLFFSMSFYSRRAHVSRIMSR